MLQNRHELMGQSHPHLPREGWWGRSDSFLRIPKPETLFPEEAVAVACGPESGFAIPSPLLLPSPSPLLCPHQLPPTLSLCPEAIDSSHSISIDLFLSQFLYLPIINRSTRPISSL